MWIRIHIPEENPDKLFIFLAHEERGEPYTATAKMIKRLADRIVRVQGLVATVGGRTTGGQFIIDQEKAMILHGSDMDLIWISMWILYGSSICKCVRS